jgi:hypothetical protein
MTDKWTTNIQWKGTDLCMDFICPQCDAQSHFDGMFAHTIQCPGCKQRYRMPTDVAVTPCAANDPAPCLTDEDSD